MHACVRVCAQGTVRCMTCTGGCNAHSSVLSRNDDSVAPIHGRFPHRPRPSFLVSSRARLMSLRVLLTWDSPSFRPKHSFSPPPSGSRLNARIQGLFLSSRPLPLLAPLDCPSPSLPRLLPLTLQYLF
eukprot:scaffold202396_cov35-Tisochrysis_lutea.AAC.1